MLLFSSENKKNNKKKNRFQVQLLVLAGYSGFLPPSKNMHVRLTGDSKIVLGSECERVCGCLSLCGPVMDWRPVQGVPRLSPDDCWDRLQPPCGYRKWMDGTTAC